MTVLSLVFCVTVCHEYACSTATVILKDNQPWQVVKASHAVGMLEGVLMLVTTTSSYLVQQDLNEILATPQNEKEL